MGHGNDDGEFLFGNDGLGGQDTGGPGDRREVERDFSDLNLVHYIGLWGAVGIEHVELRFGVGRSAAYDRVARCVEAGLLERVALLREEPTLLRATAVGLRFACLDGYAVARVSPGSARHWLRCASVGAFLGNVCGWDKVGENPDGSPRLHRPDLALVCPPVPLPVKLPLAVEVELSAKSPRRLAEIMRAWRRASWVGNVLYLCEPGKPYRALSRAVRKAHAQERVLVWPLNGSVEGKGR